VGQIARHKLRRGRDRASPGEKVVEIAAIGAAGVRRGRCLDQLANSRIEACGAEFGSAYAVACRMGVVDWL